MKKLKDILKESNVQIGKVYSNPYATAFVKENEEEKEPQMELSEEQKKAFLEAVKQYKKYGEAVYRNAGLGEVYESIKNMVEMAGKVTLSETDDWFDNVTVSRHMKRMGESFKVFEKTLKEVSTLQQRLEASYDEIGEVLGKYYEISEELDPVGKEDDDIDNDGDSDESDKYLANRRKVISKAIKKESMKLTDMIPVNEDIKSIDNSELKRFIDYMNDFYGKRGVYSSGKDLKPNEVIKALNQVFKKNKKYEWGGGDSVDREFTRDELMKMGVLSDEIYKKESVNEARTVSKPIKVDDDTMIQIVGDDKGFRELTAALNPKTGNPIQKFGFDRGNEIANSKEELIKKLQKKYGKGFKFESVNEGKDDFMARFGSANINLKKGYKHHNEDELYDLYDKLGKLVKTLRVKDVTLVFESVNEMQVVNKKTGEDVTKHLIDLLSGKIDKKEFEKRTGLKKESMKLTDMIEKESVSEALSVDPRKVYGGTGAKEGMVLVAQKGLAQILDLSKKNPSNVFKISDDNYTNFGPYYVKNGKIAKYTVANPNYDFEKNKVRSLKVPSDVILKFVIVEGSTSVNEAKYDIGMARKGNGITVYNRAEEEKGDYKNIAHISDNGTVKYYDKKLPNDIKKKIEAEAQKMKESVNIAINESQFKVGDTVIVTRKDGKKYNGKVEKLNPLKLRTSPSDTMVIPSAYIKDIVVKESVNEGKNSMKLTSMLKESFGFGQLPSSKLMKMKVPAKQVLKEGTRSQVGYIDTNGNIKSAYVHFDGYPENMKPGIKKHMKSEKDVKTLIKRGGARGIFDDKPIEYYDDKSVKPMSGNLEDIETYIKDSDFKGGAEFVYLYNTKDKKWYFADTYKDKELKKLY